MSEWRSDKRWSDRFLPEIKGIIGTHLIAEPPYEEDAERNTDLMVLRLDAIRIGCRIRKFKFASSYPDEFTIRTSRPSGAKTELGKIVEGWGDYFFYGFSDERESELCSWALCDLKVFRSWFSRELTNKKGEMPGKQRTNHDGSSSFAVFNIKDLPQGFVVARA
jgi:hypothetical protein